MLLWILLDPPAEPREVPKFSYVTVKQSGLWHLQQIKFDPEGGSGISMSPRLYPLFTPVAGRTDFGSNEREIPPFYERDVPGDVPTFLRRHPSNPIQKKDISGHHYADYFIETLNKKPEDGGYGILFNYDEGTGTTQAPAFPGEVFVGTDSNSKNGNITFFFRKCRDNGTHEIVVELQNQQRTRSFGFYFDQSNHSDNKSIVKTDLNEILKVVLGIRNGKVHFDPASSCSVIKR